MDIVISCEKDYKKLKKYLNDNNIKNLFVVTYHYDVKPSVISFLESLDINITFFTGYTPNPLYEEVCKGVKLFKESKSDAIFAIGGGSCMDVSKCIKVFASMDDNKNYLEQEILDNNISLICLPTTAGTGSEATRYAVIYYEGRKQSVTSDYLLPNLVLFDSSFLKGLSDYSKKVTLLDAFSHSIESYWSVNSNDISKEYSLSSLDILIDKMNRYFKGDVSVYSDILKASNIAGKAINITQTTAGHAMCYKLTSLYHIAHGHAAILINSVLLPYMVENINKCCDSRGEEYLIDIFNSLLKVFKCESFSCIEDMVDRLGLYDIEVDINDIDTLVNSVNVTRLKNNPVKLDSDDIREIYVRLFNIIERRKK